MPEYGTYQEACYKAEHVLDRKTRVFTDIRQVRAYVDALVESEWFYDRWPRLETVTVHRKGSGATWSQARGHGPECGEIFLAPKALDLATVLHELAHLCCSADEGHGLLFVETLLTLVRHEIGFQAWADLYYALRSTKPFAYIREGIPCNA